MDPDGLLSRIAPYAACCIVSALVFLILGWAAAKKGARLPGWLSALANRLGGLGNQETVTEEQLLDLVDDAGEQEVIDDDQAEMINSVVELADVTAGHIMTHRTDMTALEENMPCREAVETALASGCSRMPVYRKTVDEIVGILYVKDLLVLMRSPEEAHLPVRELMRPAMFVPESCPAQRLLLDFRRRHTMMAVVVDEYGGTAGLVTMEDVLEEIVGSIQDEYDQEDEELAPVEGVTFTNSYAPLSTSVTLGGTKKLNGRNLAADEFTFELCSADGRTVLSTAANRADGSFSFAPLAFDAAGTYNYTVREKNTGAARVTYDQTVYTVTVKVVNKNGQLTAEVTLPDGGLTFTNTYTPKPDHKDKPKQTPAPTSTAQPAAPTQSPRTGDNASLMTWVGILLVCGTALAGLYVYKKRKQK